MLDRKAALQQRLLHAMGEGRAYAREGLTLAQLAHQLDTSPAKLREAINENLGYRNFNDFLHHYRIDEAAQRLTAQDLPILSIALDVGYGSTGPFNRAFKQLKGMTPSEFRSAVTIVDSSVAG
jgi:AraC-like DNA-binding protein